MAQILINGICSGSETKHSAKSGKDYTITRFVEVPSLQGFDLFGDFNLQPSQEVKQYVFEAGIEALKFPKLISVNPVSAVTPVKK